MTTSIKLTEIETPLLGTYYITNFERSDQYSDMANNSSILVKKLQPIEDILKELSNTEREIDCGFDIYPPLESTSEHGQKFLPFLKWIQASFSKTLLKSRHGYYEFMTGTKPIIPTKCKKFLRFSSFVNGEHSRALQMILSVYKAAVRYFGEGRVYLWSNLFQYSDTDFYLNGVLSCGFYHADEISYIWNWLEEDKKRKRRKRNKKGTTSIEEDKTPPEIDASSPLAQTIPQTFELLPYTIKPVQSKGIGMVATVDIRRGARIMAEASLFTWQAAPKAMRAFSSRNAHKFFVREQNRILTAVGKLTPEQKAEFFTLHNCRTPDSAIGICNTNAFEVNEPELGIFLLLSRINHSCNSNTYWSWNKHIGKMVLHAIRDIAQGQEITVGYLEDDMTLSERQRDLKKDWGFECDCALCNLSSDQMVEHDRRIKEIRDMSKVRTEIFARIDASTLGEAMRKDVKELLSLLRKSYFGIKKEDQIQSYLYEIFRQAATCAVYRGDSVRAEVFLEKAFENMVRLTGHDCETSLRVKLDSEKGVGCLPTFNKLLMGDLYSKERPEGLSEENFETWLWYDGT